MLTNFVIEAPNLAIKSRKPRHLEKRLRARVLLGPQLAVAKAASFQECLDRHDSILKTRKLKLQKRLKKVHENKKSLDQQIVEKRALLAKSIEMSLRQSEAKRIESQSIPRSRLLHPKSRANQALVAQQHQSALLIQNWYRGRKFIPIQKIYRRVGLSRENASKMTFNQLSARISNQVVVKAASYVLIRAKRISGMSKHVFKTPARILLSCFMLVFFPKDILNDQNAQSQDLENLAQNLITDLDHWMASSNSAVIAPLATTFMSTFTSFYNAFEAWKQQDSLKIIDELIGHFMELDMVWVKVHADEGAMQEWAEPVADQQQQHLNRIKKFGPEAIARLVQQRESFKATLVAQKVLIEFGTNLEPTAAAHKVYLVMKKDPTQFVGSESNSAAAEAEENDMPSTQEMSQFGAIFSNEQLAHELVMDPDFRLKPTERSPLEIQVRDMARKAYIDATREEIEENILDKSVLTILEDIRTGLVSMVNEKGAIAQEINEVFERDFIAYQIKNKVFDLKSLVQYAGEKMLQLCAPLRDASIRELSFKVDMAVILFGILDILEEMKLDLANFRMQTIKPQLKKQAVDYERQKFDAALDAGTASLSKTELRLLESFVALKSVVDERNPENVDHPDLKLKNGQVYNQMVLNMLFSATPIDPASLPETFSMDAKRLFEMQNELQACTIVAALTMLSKSIIPELGTDAKTMKQLSDSLFKLLKSESVTGPLLASEIVSCANIVFHKQTKVVADLSKLTSTPAQQTLKQVGQEQIELVKSMVEKTISHKDPFFSVLSRRMERLVKVAIEKEFQKSALQKNGLAYIGTEFELLVDRITILIQHNRDVYGKHYDAIISKFQ